MRIPQAVQSLGASAFGQTSIAALTFEDDSKLITIGAGAFDITKIKTIQAPRFTLTKNADNTTYTLAVAEGVTTVAKGEFSSRESTGRNKKSKITLNTRLKGALLGARPNRVITAITLPSTLETIEDYGFYNHSYLQGTLTIPSKVQSIGEYAFKYIGSLYTNSSSLVIAFAPDSQLTTIEADAFSNNAITGLTLPEQLETIGTRAFAFSNDTDEKMSSFTIPVNVTRIEAGAFAFANMKFSNSVTLTIQSPSVTLGDQLFVLSPTDTVFTTVKLPQVVYDGLHKGRTCKQIRSGYRIPGLGRQRPHPQAVGSARGLGRYKARKLPGPGNFQASETSGPWLIAEKSAWVALQCP